MNPETIQEYERASRLAEALYRVIETHKLEDQDLNHHTRNAVQSLRGVDFVEDSESEIIELCASTQKRLAPFLHFLKLLQNANH